MNEKTKLYVFTRLELIVAFLFMISSGPVLFLIGVQLGKSYSYKMAGLTPQDRRVLEYKSTKEDSVSKIAETVMETEAEKEKKIEDLDAISIKKIKMKIENVSEIEKEGAKEQIGSPAKDDIFSVEDKLSRTMRDAKHKDAYTGKFTIQLASYPTIKEAEVFANGFKVRGYNTIISEKVIKGRGTWFRVSLGSFESIAETKKYMEDERELFTGADAHIRRFD